MRGQGKGGFTPPPSDIFLGKVFPILGIVIVLRWMGHFGPTQPNNNALSLKVSSSSEASSFCLTSSIIMSAVVVGLADGVVLAELDLHIETGVYTNFSQELTEKEPFLAHNFDLFQS